MNSQYIYGEPEIETREVYVDQDGGVHNDRDTAVTENIKSDLVDTLMTEMARAWPDDKEALGFIAQSITRKLTRRGQFREMVRQLIDSTD